MKILAVTGKGKVESAKAKIYTTADKFYGR